MADQETEKEKEVFLHPETGEVISKNAYKKLLKGVPAKKEKKDVKPAAEKAVKTKKVAPPKAAEEIFSDSTPSGLKKKIEDVFPTSYQPKYVEAAWQPWWEKEGFYKADVSKALNTPEEKKFVMVIPPPNVTGSLHLGHALTVAVEDTLTRWHRMKGKVALWVPGTDHAGIATQAVVEKRLKKDEGLSRHDLGREKFIEKVWEWKHQYGNTITKQIRYLGASVDWTRESFTMDKNLSTAVTEAFCKFHEDGLLYRDTRLINWSCALQSAISEIEVDYLELEGKTFLAVPNHKLKEKYEFGMITSFAYKVVDGEPGKDEIVVATTRLETMLGDSAVAVHPEDPRYKHMHGKFLQHPFLDRKIPIITDDVLVDMSFGTGAVKVTPAHDPNDYLCGKRHNLEFTTVLTGDGRITVNNGGIFAGMMRYDARVAMEKEMTDKGIFRGKEVNKMRLGLCQRSGDIIEPMCSPQWYVNCNSMAKRSTDAVRNGDLKILPEMHEPTWFRWLDNIKDWCVSRQLWWGHRIPAYFVRLPGEDNDSCDRNDPANNDRWFVDRTEAAARAKAAAELGVDGATLSLTQDEDVLDTWFSSGLFPFSVFGWPNNTDDFKAFFPTSLLETGLDILFFWVARMVMMSLHLTDKLPFKTVYLHAMVRDKSGRKMSKSLGNVIDPLEVINGCGLEELLAKIDQGNLPVKEIAKAKAAQVADFPDGILECGADALRFGLLAYTVQGRDVNLDIKRVVGYRQFCNKIWNAFKFAISYLSDFKPTATMHLDVVNHPAISSRDLFIMSKLNGCIEECNSSLTSYLFGMTTSALHSFFLYDVCDLYLELLKPVFQDKSEENNERRFCAQVALYTVLEHFMRLAHPIMPFITEELWQRLPDRSNFTDYQSIVVAAYPEPSEFWACPVAEKNMELVKEAISGARSIRADYKVPNHVKADFYFRSNSAEVREALSSQADDFCTLAKGYCLKAVDDGEEVPKSCCVKVISDSLSLLVDLSGLLDVDSELKRLSKEEARLAPQLESYKRKINAPDYATKVPENVQKLNGEKLASYEAEMKGVQDAIVTFQAMKEEAS